MTKKKAILVDLDGTLCNTDHRQHHMETKPKDWMAFYGGIPDDTPHVWCNTLISWVPGGIEVVFVTGRPDNYRKQSSDWLWKNSRAMGQLFMRKEGDFRKDCVVKEEIYRTEIEPKYDILFCLDDRKQVVDMWRSIGLTCLQCAPGEF